MLHWSFGLVGAALIYLRIDKQMDPAQLLWITLAAFALFVSILLHEFGHALVARRYGVETKDIILLPIGGLARLNKLPEKPFQEFVVALAGPLVNFAIAILLLPYLYFVMVPGIEARGVPTPDLIMNDYFYFIPFLFAMNIGLGVFNLLPAFPMDGGRIFRALLATWLGKLRATRIAMVTGQSIAVGMVIFGFTGYNYFYILIGIFIFFAALKEFRWVKMESTLAGLYVRDIVNSNFMRLQVTDSIQTVFDHVRLNPAQPFLVFGQGGELVGTLTGEAASAGVEKEGSEGVIQEFYQPEFAYLTMDTNLKEVNEQMQSSGSEILPVIDNGILTGVVDRESMQKFLEEKYGKR